MLREMRLARGGCTLIAAAASASRPPHRAQLRLPGMFSNWQLGHCIFVVAEFARIQTHFASSLNSGEFSYELRYR
jgi:hypothetical protein